MRQTVILGGLKLKIDISRNDIIAFLICISTIIHVSILFQVEYLLGGRWHSILYLIMYASILCSYFLVVVGEKGKLCVGSSILIPVSCWIFYICNVYEKVNWSWNSLILLTYLLFFVVGSEVRYKAFLLFRKFVIVISFFGVILYVLNFFSVYSSFDVVQYYPYYGLIGEEVNKSWYYNFHNFIFLQGTLGHDIRLSGFFNEPGLNGTICALLLCADGYKIKKIGNIILFLAGICTLSLAFIFISLTYFILYMKKHLKRGVMLLVIFVVLFSIFQNFHFRNNALLYLQNRLTFENGKLIGNSRETTSETSELFCKTLRNKPLFGNGRGYSSLESDQINVLNLIIDYGIIGILIMYVPLLVFGLNKAKGSWEAISFALCFMVSILQRYDILAIEYFLIFFGGLEWRKYNTIIYFQSI